MRVTKHRVFKRKWIVADAPAGWASRCEFPTKWRADIAMKVLLQGGSRREYLAQVRKEKEHRPDGYEPYKARAEVAACAEELDALDPTSEEIIEYARTAPHGVVTRARSEDYFWPSVHDTHGKKWGGRVHIDLGAGGYHLMLDRIYARHFIEFIRERRQQQVNAEQL